MGYEIDFMLVRDESGGSNAVAPSYGMMCYDLDHIQAG